ncbi:MAG: UDP-N-acetylglucosamine 2-epimerase (hydrolyzing) [Kiritimatiellae bacterium]|nr:UDP-N-acetylglucosamine 2-epimerase (hydrolyzing) [Kiritimatiellia bacterium]
MRRILYVTGSRADYGPMRRVLQAIRQETQLDLALLVTSMHLDSAHGETWREVQADGFAIAERIPGRVAGDSLTAMAASVGLYAHGMASFFAQWRPDVVLVLGDRGEMLAAAIAAAYQNMVVAHLCGGSTSGSIDDAVRHAITKFAHYHLPACEEHARRILQMGEESWRVRVVGLPGADLTPDVRLSSAEVKTRLDIPGDAEYVLVIQHAVTSSHADTQAQITETLEALRDTPCIAILANPNDDAGGRVIMKAYEAYAARDPRFRLLPPPRSREVFASIMAHASAIVGNSSCGVAEAMSVGVPVVNIGDRQRGREHLSCMLNVSYERGQIGDAVRRAMRDSAYRAKLVAFRSPLVSRDVERNVVTFLCEADLARAVQPKEFVDLVDHEDHG